MHGHKISKRTIEVDKDKIEVIEKLPLPVSVKGIPSFFVHTGFYRHFIKDLSEISNPLCNLCDKKLKFDFHEVYMKDFEGLIDRLVSAPITMSLD